jgi:hypothetical protein
MTINEFLKAIQKEFGQVEYRATSNDGKVFKSKGWESKYGKENDSKRSEFPRVHGYGQKRN